MVGTKVLRSYHLYQENHLINWPESTNLENLTADHVKAAPLLDLCGLHSPSLRSCRSPLN